MYMSLNKATAGLAISLLCTLSAASAGGAEAEPAQWKSTAKASYVRTSGNSDTETLAGELESSFEPEPNRYFLKASVLFAEQNGVESSSRWFLEGRYERAITGRLFGWASLGYLKDKFAGYDSQITFGPGLGYNFIKWEHMSLKGLIGVLYTMDNYVGNREDEYFAGTASVDYRWQIFENLGFRQYAGHRTSLEDTDIFFFKSETSLDVKVRDNLSLGLAYIIDYQNEPPPGSEHTDTRFLTSVVVDF